MLLLSLFLSLIAVQPQVAAPAPPAAEAPAESAASLLKVGRVAAVLIVLAVSDGNERTKLLWSSRLLDDGVGVGVGVAVDGDDWWWWLTRTQSGSLVSPGEAFEASWWDIAAGGEASWRRGP